MNGMRNAVISGLVTLMAGLACAQGTRMPDADREVAIINGQPLTSEKLTSFAMQLEMNENRRFGDERALLDEYILTQLYDKIPTTATLPKEEQAASGSSPYTSAEQRQLIKRIYQKKLAEDIEVPRSEMEAWYKTNVDKYVQPERVHAWHLFMETSKDDQSSSPERVKAHLKEIRKEVESGTSFSVAAKEYSEAASGKSGGEIGRITPRMPIGPLSKPMNIELETAFFELQPNKVSDVVETNHGMHLLYITEKQTTVTPTLDDLITSRILPGALAQDHATSRIKEAIEDARKLHAAQVLPNNDKSVTSATVAFSLDGKPYTIDSLMNIYGRRFTSFLDNAKHDQDMLKDLMKQAMEDEVLVQAAVDAGVDKATDVKDELNGLGLRSKASKRLDAIVEAETQVSDADVKARYDQLQEELRRPEAEGYLITFFVQETTGTAEEAKAREDARKAADQWLERLKSGDFKKTLDEIRADSSIKTSITQVARHTMGQTTGTEDRLFDQAASGVVGQEGFSQVMPMGATLSIVRVDKRYPGEPVPLDQIRERIAEVVKTEKQTQVRAELAKRLDKVAKIEYKLPEPAAKDDATTNAD